MKIDEDEVLYRVLLLFAAFAAVFTWGIYLFDAEEIFMTPCPFWRLTGLYCPGCGGTRALVALVNGRFAESIRIHPLVIYLAGFFLVFAVSHTLKHMTKGRIRGLHYRGLYLAVGAGILVINCIWKNYNLIEKGIGLPGQ